MSKFLHYFVEISQKSTILKRVHTDHNALRENDFSGEKKCV